MSTADLYWTIGSGSTADNVYLGQGLSPVDDLPRAKSDGLVRSRHTRGRQGNLLARGQARTSPASRRATYGISRPTRAGGCSTGAIRSGVPASRSFGKAFLPLIPSLLALSVWSLAKRRAVVRKAVVSVAVVAILAASGAAIAATYYDNPLTFTINHYTRVTAVFVEKAEVSLTINDQRERIRLDGSYRAVLRGRNRRVDGGAGSGQPVHRVVGRPGGEHEPAEHHPHHAIRPDRRADSHRGRQLGSACVAGGTAAGCARCQWL